MRPAASSSHRRGFTMVEIIMVCVILALLLSAEEPLGEQLWDRLGAVHLHRLPADVIQVVDPSARLVAGRVLAVHHQDVEGILGPL